MKKILSALIAIILISSCGGGSTTAEKTPTIKLKQKIMYIKAQENGSADIFKDDILFEIENAKGLVYVIAQNDNPELIDRIYMPFVSVESHPYITVYPAHPIFTGIKKGTYQGTITLKLCEDNQCNKPIAHSEAIINIVYDVL